MTQQPSPRDNSDARYPLLPLNPVERPERRVAPPAPMQPMSKVPYVPFDYARHQPQPTRPRAGTRETQKAHYAFLIYCSLGTKRRSYKRVLDHLVLEGKLGPKSLRQIEIWGKQFNWFERAKEYDAAVVEKEREEWDAARILRLQQRAASAGDGYDEAVAHVLERLKDARNGKGRVPFEAVVQAVKILADVEYRDRNDLTEHAPEAAKATGISITIDAYGGANATPRALPAPSIPAGPGTTITPMPTEGMVRTPEDDEDGSLV